MKSYNISNLLLHILQKEKIETKIAAKIFKGPDTPDAIRQRDAIFRFSLTDNFDPSLNFPNI
jgi:hypothetical protein